jgi:hypothetical protein
MSRWVDRLRVDPLPVLLAADDAAVAWRTRHDLLAEGGDPRSLWTLPEVTAALRRQRADGSWRYGRRAARRETEYDQLATYEALLPLVEKHCGSCR